MPELPEVETTRRHLEPILAGRRIDSAWIGRDRTGRRNARAADIPDRLAGKRVGAVGRRGKFIMIDVSEDLLWVIHLGMSGRMSISTPDDHLEPHTHFTATTDRGDQVRFVDPRTFGFVAVFTPEELDVDPLATLGRDAYESLPSTDEIVSWLAGRTAPIKGLLLDQRFMSGLGNIYADEVLHRAGIHPRRPGGQIDRSEIDMIRPAIADVLQAGIDMGGTSLDDLAYLLPDGRAGAYLDRLRVYGRENQPCLACGTPIDRIVVAQRSSHFCRNCQA